MEQIDEKRYRLTSGRVLEAAAGAIGIANGVVLSGYEELPADEWTPEDRSELADFMIGQWRRFKQESTPEGEGDEVGSNATGGFIVISDTDDGTAVFGRSGGWLPEDVTSAHRRQHALTFPSIGEAWRFLDEKPADWWLAVPGSRPRVVQVW